jgi:predicted nucleotidyltransferase
MHYLCKMLGGSHSYGLNTPTSDIDYRGVFVNTDAATIVGMGKHEHQQKQDEETDEVYTELRNFFKLLRNGNTQMIELMYANSFLETSPEWQIIQGHRANLVSSEKLFSCLRGYMQSELRLANGERTGKLGGKRKESLDKYGFSPKNFVQLFRLAWAGTVYFQKGFFPVNMKEHDAVFASYLLDLKTKPERFSKEGLNLSAGEWEKELVSAYETRKHTTVFNEQLANDLCLKVYTPIINQLFINI